MINKTAALFLFLFQFSICLAQQKEVCFTFDDLPVVTYGLHKIDYQQEVTRKLVSTLKKRNIPAIGFVNESSIYSGKKPDAAKIALLEEWLKAGMELGNHSYSHPDYHKVNFKVYSEDILKGEKISRPLSTRYGKEFKYYRHPYLHTGNSKEKTDSLSLFLQEKDYLEAPVSIDNSDYIFAKAYDNANINGDKELMKSLGEHYVNYMEKNLRFYENQSHKLFGYNIKHILLLHANLLNAHFVDELADMYQKNGYAFVSLEKALTDEAYKSESTYYGRGGISWIDRWALTAGNKGDFFKEDPRTPDFVLKAAGIESE
ncbi:polysaccharide deacetylase family protein [soil metagenome]